MPTNNHPNRNWRARMRAACSQWLDTVAMPGAAVLQTREQMRESLAVAFSAGFEAGRKSTSRAGVK